MKKKTALTISVVMMVAILATILSYTFAWFSASNSMVKAEGGTFSSAETDSAFITSADDNMVSKAYGGETGKDIQVGQDDYPFKAITTFSVKFKPKSSNTVITGSLSSAKIKMKDYSENEETGEIKGLISSENDERVLQNFSWDIYLVSGENVSGSYYPDHFFGKNDGLWYDSEQNVVENVSFVQYFPSECFGKDDKILRDIDGNTLSVGEADKEHEYVFVIEITFLDRESYCLFKNASGEPHPEHTTDKKEITAFAYSDYIYMQSIFEIFFDVGFTRVISA